MTILGGTFQFESDAFIAVSGSQFDILLDGKAFDHHIVIYIRNGQKLAIRQTTSGARCYLCVRGGIEVENYLSGKTTHVLTGMGGHYGRALKKGDTLSACVDMHTSVKLGFKDAGTSLFFYCK